MGQDIGNKGHVGLHAPHANLTQSTGRLVAHAQEGVVPGGDLHQQGVVVGRYHCAHAAAAAVHADAEAAGGAVGGYFAGVGGKIICGVLGGDAALDGIAVHMYGGLILNAYQLAAEGIPLGYKYLGTDYVYAGDDLCDGVLHLNAGVHFYKVVLALAVNKELKGAGGHIAHVLCYLHSVGV